MQPEVSIIRGALLQWCKVNDGLSLEELQDPEAWKLIDDFDDYVEDAVNSLLADGTVELRFIHTQPWIKVVKWPVDID